MRRRKSQELHGIRMALKIPRASKAGYWMHESGGDAV